MPRCSQATSGKQMQTSHLAFCSIQPLGPSGFSMSHFFSPVHPTQSGASWQISQAAHMSFS